MRKLVLLAVIMCIGGLSSLSAERCMAGAPEREFRAAWVTAWSNGFLSPEQADETIRLAAKANLNAILVQVRKVGDAYYDSAYEPRGDNIIAGGDYDPLAYMIEKGHAAGLEVHAWINVFRVWRSEDSALEPCHVTVKHPEWLNKTRTGKVSASDGNFLDPGIPEVKNYVADIVTDLLSKYDVDGIHLDYIRYPGQDFGYSPTSIYKFNEFFGRAGRPRNDDPEWCQWRRDQVTQTLRKIYHVIRAVKPAVKLTVAGIPWGECPFSFEQSAAYRTVYQDWAGWLREGIVDACVPMNYRDQRNPDQARAYYDWLDGMCRWKANRLVYAGLMVGADVEAAVQQIKISRNAGLDGVVAFAFNAAPWRENLVDALRTEVFQAPAETPPMPWKSEQTQVASAEEPKGG